MPTNNNFNAHDMERSMRDWIAEFERRLDTNTYVSPEEMKLPLLEAKERRERRDSTKQQTKTVFIVEGEGGIINPYIQCYTDYLFYWVLQMFKVTLKAKFPKAPDLFTFIRKNESKINSLAELKAILYDNFPFFSSEDFSEEKYEEVVNESLRKAQNRPELENIILYRDAVNKLIDRLKEADEELYSYVQNLVITIKISVKDENGESREERKSIRPSIFLYLKDDFPKQLPSAALAFTYRRKILTEDAEKGEYIRKVPLGNNEPNPTKEIFLPYVKKRNTAEIVAFSNENITYGFARAEVFSTKKYDENEKKSKHLSHKSEDVAPLSGYIEGNGADVIGFEVVLMNYKPTKKGDVSADPRDPYGDITLANELGDVMFFMEYNKHAVETDRSIKPMKKKDLGTVYNKLSGTIYSFAVEYNYTTKAIPSYDKFARSKYPLVYSNDLKKRVNDAHPARHP